MSEQASQTALLHATDLVRITTVAVALRIAVFATAMMNGPLTVEQYATKGDTSSYVAVASAMSGERTYNSLGEYDRRVFPGYPALIAIIHLGKVPLPIAAFCVTWISAGVAASAAAMAFDDLRVGWAMVCLLPHFVINSSLGMSEAPLLAGISLAFLFYRLDLIITAGVFFGLASLIRPMGCFALGGVIFAMVRDRHWSNGVRLCAAAAVVFSAGLVAMQWWTGNALQGIHVYANHPGAYAGRLIVWPFETLIRQTHRASPGRIFYIWSHVAVVLFAVLIAGWRTLSVHRADTRDSASFPWLLGNTAMVLCLGPPWGFEHFPRFAIPAAPAMFWTLRAVLPRHRLIWIGITIAAFVFAVAGVIQST